MLRSYKKKAWPLSPCFQVLAWLVHQITALLYILPWKTPGSQETQQHPARSPASAPRLLTGDGDCALVCWSSSSPQRHESGDWALTWRTLLDCLDRTFRLFPLSIATWTLWGGQLTSFLGSTLWLRRPFFALGSWVTFSCGHYKSNILLFGTLGNTSVLRILVVDPQVEGSPSIHSAATCFVIAVGWWWKSLWTCRAEQRTYSPPTGWVRLQVASTHSHLCTGVLTCAEHFTDVCMKGKEDVKTCLWQRGMYTEVSALKMQNNQDLLPRHHSPVRYWWTRYWTLPLPHLGPHSWTSRTCLHGGTADVVPAHHRPFSSPYCASRAVGEHWPWYPVCFQKESRPYRKDWEMEWETATVVERVQSMVWTLPKVKSICNNLTKADTQA